ncbi:GDP-mannose transporter [Hamiltosporidium tvaerminnensis]|uniref:GDP-mannose transporter n=2 Tax=Hamiltosporidium TaxID=1176354 RepID=A0A4Q9LNQ5_9MICR|nr:GDP-mannose transporter into the lumen of the Golgi [Hamiltosporidium tvaerminnensis]TBU03611.1 GDP-mannose transporter [Hamiltosporidium tvaerminnensis]TBU07975.1 GDP-mannose transporter [Hamiltosporidium magnivora]TBU09964.1 GDP-mannose transporter [Hamiltosporidium magnivora]TBU20924.1 GDP-mannose transporter [Hamiltosporidium tvaerminnensis]
MENKNSEKILIVITSIISSLLTMVANKYIVSVLKFEMQFLFLGIQSTTVVIVLSILISIKIINVKNTRWKGLIRWSPSALLLSLMIYTGSKSIYYLPISIFSIFKNVTIIVVAVAEWFLYRKKIDKISYISFGCVFLSSLIGEKANFKIEFYGYFWTILNIFFTAFYLIFLKITIKKENTNDFESVFYCNLISIPILFGCSLIFDKIDIRILNFDRIMINILFWIFLSSISAFFISYSTVWCLRLLSSTTLSMLGAINKILVSFSGILIIGEDNVNIVKIISLVIGSAAGILYSFNIRKE